jgi:hypothetical protein
MNEVKRIPRLGDTVIYTDSNECLPLPAIVTRIDSDGTLALKVLGVGVMKDEIKITQTDAKPGTADARGKWGFRG